MSSRTVIDLAVGVIIGAAFGRIVDSIVGDLFMPIVGAVEVLHAFIAGAVPIERRGSAIAMFGGINKDRIAGDITYIPLANDPNVSYGSATPERRTELDAIRVLVVAGLVFFHAAAVLKGMAAVVDRLDTATSRS